MDYRQFFDELKACYLSHGLAFEYDFDKSVSKGCKSSKWPKFHQVLSKNISKGLGNKNYAYSNSKGSQNYQDHASKNSMKFEKIVAKNCFFFPRFSSVGDMVYYLAWELALKVGRLPDALHARMIFSLDGHRAVRNYIKKFGV